MDLFDLFARIRVDTSEFDSELSEASQKFSKAGEMIAKAGATLTKGVTLPIVGLGAAIIKTGSDYEAGMSKVQAISGATGEEVRLLGDEAMRMAAQTKFSTSEAAEAYQYMAMAGWDTGQMIDGLSGIMLLASASGESLASTSDIVTDALTAFGMTAADSGRFADVLAAASNSANTNVSMLGESFKYVAPVAGALGYSVEDTSVALGLMANSGIKASQAGTSLRTAITNMASPTKDMSAVMEEYGITLTDANGDMLSLADVMSQLRDKMGGLDASTQASAASMLFGKEAMSGMLAIINAAPEDFNKLTEAIGHSAGTTQEMAAVMNDNAAGAVAMLHSAINVLFTSLSEFLIPAFTDIVRKVTEVVQWFNDLDGETQKLILAIAGIAAAVGPVLIVIGKLITALGTIGSAVSSVAGAVTSGISAIMRIGGVLMGGIKALFALILAHPVVAVVTAIIAAIMLLWQNCEAFRDAVGAIWEAIKGYFVGAWEAVQAVWGHAGEFFSGIVDSIKGAFSDIGRFLGDLFSIAWDAVKAAWAAAVEFFTGIVAGTLGAFEAVGDTLSGLFSDAWEAIKGTWEGAVAFFGEVWDSIKGTAASAAEAVGGALVKAWDKVTSAWERAAGFFSDVAGKIIGVFSDIGSRFFEIGGSIVSGIWDGISSAWGAFMGWLDGKVGGIVDGVKAMLGIHSPSTVFAGIGKNMALGLADGWDGQYKAIKRQIEGGLDFAPVSIGVAGAYGGGHDPYPMQQSPQRGGDTFNFYSPKALDPVSAAREMRKAKQLMALGYV